MEEDKEQCGDYIMPGQDGDSVEARMKIENARLDLADDMAKLAEEAKALGIDPRELYR